VRDAIHPAQVTPTGPPHWVTGVQPEVLTLTEALKGGPGLRAYVYDAELYCVECGQDHLRRLFKRFPNGILAPFASDSDLLPQPVFFGEHEEPQYCDKCAVYLYGGVEGGEDECQ
jgi:hypothetical protein